MPDFPATTDPMVGNLAVLSNAVELATKVVMQTSGDSVSMTLGGEPVTENFIADAVSARLQAKLAPYVGGV